MNQTLNSLLPWPDLDSVNDIKQTIVWTGTFFGKSVVYVDRVQKNFKCELSENQTVPVAYFKKISNNTYFKIEQKNLIISPTAMTEKFSINLAGNSCGPIFEENHIFEEINENVSITSCGEDCLPLNMVEGFDDPSEIGDRCMCNNSRDGSKCCYDNSCINFATQTECPLGACHRECQNQRIQAKIYAKLEVFDAGRKGRGLRAKEEVQKDQFIIEYIGEIIDFKEKNRRVHKEEKGVPKMYLMELKTGVFLDARYKGGISRFINHSCEPNCRVERWNAGGRIRCAVFALKNISVDTELTFDYKWHLDESRSPTRCFCGTPSCRMFIEVGPIPEHCLKEPELPPELQRGFYRAPTVEESNDGHFLVGRKVKICRSKVGGFLTGEVISYIEDSNTHFVRFEGKSLDDLSEESLVGIASVEIWMLWEPRENGPIEGFIPKKIRSQESQNQWWSSNEPVMPATVSESSEVLFQPPSIGFTRIRMLEDDQLAALQRNNCELLGLLKKQTKCQARLFKGFSQVKASIKMQGDLCFVERGLNFIPLLCQSVATPTAEISENHSSEQSKPIIRSERLNWCMGWDWESFTVQDISSLPPEVTSKNAVDFYGVLEGTLKILRNVTMACPMPQEAIVHACVLLIRYEVSYALLSKVTKGESGNKNSNTLSIPKEKCNLMLAMGCALLAIKTLSARCAMAVMTNMEERLLETGYSTQYPGSFLKGLDMNERKKWEGSIAQAEDKIIRALRGDLTLLDPFKLINTIDQDFMSLKLRIIEIIRESALRGLAVWLKYSVDTIVRGSQLLALAEACCHGTFGGGMGKNLAIEWGLGGAEACGNCAHELAHFLGIQNEVDGIHYEKMGYRIRKAISQAVLNKDKSYLCTSTPPRFLPFDIPIPPISSRPSVASTGNLLYDAVPQPVYKCIRAAEMYGFSSLEIKHLKVLRDGTEKQSVVGCFIPIDYAKAAGLGCTVKDQSFMQDQFNCTLQGHTELGLKHLSVSRSDGESSSQKEVGIPSTCLRELYVLQQVHSFTGTPSGHADVLMPIDFVFGGNELGNFHILTEQKSKFVLKDVLQKCKISFKTGTTEKDYSSLLPTNYLHHLVGGLMRGVAAIHRAGYIICDFDPSHMYINGEGDLKFGGLGHAIVAPSIVPDLELDSVDVDTIQEPSAHSLPYMAPELLLGTKIYKKAGDMWAAGCIVLQLAFGKPLFSGKTRRHQADHIFKVCGTPDVKCWPEGYFAKLFNKLRPKDTSGTPLHCRSRIEKHIKEQQRVALQNHRCLNDLLCNLICRIFELDPALRLSSEDAKNHPYVLSDDPSNKMMKRDVINEWRRVEMVLRGQAISTELVSQTNILGSRTSSTSAKMSAYLNSNAFESRNTVQSETEIKTEEFSSNNGFYKNGKDRFPLNEINKGVVFSTALEKTMAKNKGYLNEEIEEDWILRTSSSDVISQFSPSKEIEKDHNQIDYASSNVNSQLFFSGNRPLNEAIKVYYPLKETNNHQYSSGTVHLIEEQNDSMKNLDDFSNIHNFSNQIYPTGGIMIGATKNHDSLKDSDISRIDDLSSFGTLEIGISKDFCPSMELAKENTMMIPQDIKIESKPDPTSSMEYNFSLKDIAMSSHEMLVGDNQCPLLMPIDSIKDRKTYSREQLEAADDDFHPSKNQIDILNDNGSPLKESSTDNLTDIPHCEEQIEKITNEQTPSKEQLDMQNQADVLPKINLLNDCDINKLKSTKKVSNEREIDQYENNELNIVTGDRNSKKESIKSRTIRTETCTESKKSNKIAISDCTASKTRTEMIRNLNSRRYPQESQSDSYNSSAFIRDRRDRSSNVQNKCSERANAQFFFNQSKLFGNRNNCLRPRESSKNSRPINAIERMSEKPNKSDFNIDSDDESQSHTSRNDNRHYRTSVHNTRYRGDSRDTHQKSIPPYKHPHRHVRNDRGKLGFDSGDTQVQARGHSRDRADGRVRPPYRPSQGASYDHRGRFHGRGYSKHPSNRGDSKHRHSDDFSRNDHNAQGYSRFNNGNNSKRSYHNSNSFQNNSTRKKIKTDSCEKQMPKRGPPSFESSEGEIRSKRKKPNSET